MIIKAVFAVIIVGVAMALYCISTSMVNKQREKDGKTGCTGNCAGCGMGCKTSGDTKKEG